LVWHSCRVHPGSDVNRVSPDVVLRLSRANYAGNDRAHVDADAKHERVVRVFVDAVQLFAESKHKLDELKSEKRWCKMSNDANAIYNKRQGRDSPKLLNVAAWQLLNKLESKIMLRFTFVLARREAEFHFPDIWHSPISVWQLPKSLLAENLLHKRLVDTGVKTLPK
jgi:hypothetical protein